MSGKEKQSPNSKPQTPKKKPRRRIQRKYPRKQPLRIEPQINDLQFQWDEDEDFVVQRIIGQQIWENKKYYLVKWKGFDIALSTWQIEDKIKHMEDLVNEFERFQKGKANNIREESAMMMNPYRATQVHGHFLYGDQPREVVNTFVQFDRDGRKTIFLEISWHHRETQEGQYGLENSILDSDLVFSHRPQFLLDFYQKSIKLHPQSPPPSTK